jgi:hypothetical protein
MHDNHSWRNNSSITHRHQGKIKTPAPQAIAAGSGVIIPEIFSERIKANSIASDQELLSYRMVGSRASVQ